LNTLLECPTEMPTREGKILFFVQCVEERRQESNMEFIIATQSQYCTYELKMPCTKISYLYMELVLRNTVYV
jgi:hypothetical protein